VNRTQNILPKKHFFVPTFSCGEKSTYKRGWKTY